MVDISVAALFNGYILTLFFLIYLRCPGPLRAADYSSGRVQVSLLTHTDYILTLHS